MKKIKISIIGMALLGLAVAGSAFTKLGEGTKQASYKWFQISGSYNPTSAVSPGDAIYLGEGTTPPAGMGCDGSLHQCVSGFNANQVNSSNQLNGTQKPVVTPVRKQ